MKITDGVQQQSCFDEKSSSVQVSMDITLEKSVWVAVGFRSTEECLMTPRGGGDGETLVALPGKDGGYTLSHGLLSPALKSFDAGGAEAFVAGITPIGNLPDLYVGGSVELSGGNFMMAFKRKYKVQPKHLNLTFALGSSASFGYHANRGCFIVSDLPACAPVVYPASGYP